MSRIFQLACFIFLVASSLPADFLYADPASRVAVHLNAAAKIPATAGASPTAAWTERPGALPPLTGYAARLRPQYQNLTHLDRWDAVEACGDQIHSVHGDGAFEVTFSLGRLEGKCDEAPVMRWGTPGGPVSAARLAIAAGANVTEVWATGGQVIFGLTIPYESGYFERRLAIVDGDGRAEIFGSTDLFDETLTILLDQFAAAEAASRGAAVFLRANGRTLAVDRETRSWWVTGPSTN